MPKFELKLQKNGEDVSRFTVGSKAMVIGRSTGADVVLPDNVISRHHARLHVSEDHLIIEDLGSTNGVLVNGERVTTSSVNEGDTVSVGKYSLVVERCRSEELLRETGALIPFEAADEVYRRFTQGDSTDPLPFLYRAAQLLGTQDDEEVLFEKILSLVFEAFPARRGFILTRSYESEAPMVRSSFARYESQIELPMSKAIIDHVFESKTAVLTANATHDPRFEGEDTIFGHGIAGAMCVPMCGRGGMVGVLYIDTDDEQQPFMAEHLELLTAMGRVVGVAVENARLHSERLQQQRLAVMGEAVAGIGHCMKNILTGLKASEEFMDMAQEQGDWNILRDGWGSMRKALKRFERLVSDLLTYARKTDLDAHLCDLNACIEEVYDSVRPRAKKRNIVITFDKERLDPIVIDSHQIFRVALNLVDNALDACKSGEGKVTVTTWQNPFGTYVEVADNGMGIKPEDFPKLSQAFYTTKGHGGTGLGLACAYRIIEQHGGKILVESEPGRGSTFTIYLPRKDAKAIAADSVRTAEFQVPQGL